MIYKHYANYIMGVARRYFNHDQSQTKEVFLKTFELAFRNIKKYDNSKGHFKSWLHKTCVNAALEKCRNDKRHQHQNIGHASHFHYDINIEEQIDCEMVMKIIDELPDPFGQIFNMVIDGYKHKEIALKFNIKEATSRSYFKRSRDMIIAKLSSMKIEI